MANQNDSFIDEVTEELRRDRLFAAFRRYGWIGIALIVLIVAGAGWREFAANRERAEARAFGDAILAAEGARPPAPALAAVADGGSADRAAVVDLLESAAQVAAGDATAAAARLEAVAAGTADPVLRDLARLKAVIAAGETMDPAARDAVLADLSQPGAPFEHLALEQQAIALMAAGRTEDAVTLIRQIQPRDGLSQGLRRRLSEMMIALGAAPDPAENGAVPAAAMPAAMQ